MKHFLVTGSQTLVGYNLIEELSKQGLPIRATHHFKSSSKKRSSDFLIEGLDLETRHVDITNKEDLYQAVQGCSIVFHTEHYYSLEKKDRSLLYQINQKGTQNLLEAAFQAGVDKVIYVSAMELLRPAPGKEIANENDGVALEDLKTDYEKSRYLAERKVIEYRQKGLPIIIVYPTVCVGPGQGDENPFGHFIQRYLQKKLLFYLDTGFNLIDVKDVAKGCILTAKRGQIGGRYILGNKNVYMLEILQQLEKMTHIKYPKMALPFFLAKASNSLLRNIFQRRAGFQNNLLETLRKPFFYDTSLARKELGLPQSDPWKALQKQVSAGVS